MLFIIFGTRGITSTSDTGAFHCPVCEVEQPYRHRRVRRFFTLYFIPLIPLDSVGEYVECERCQGTFKPEVLEFSPEAARQEFEAAFERAVRRILVQMALADREVTPDEVSTVQDVYGRVTGGALGQEAILEEVDRVRADGRPLEDFLQEVAYQLNDHGKEAVLRAAFAVAAADGQMREEEQRLLGKLGRTLDMTPSHVRGVLDSLVSGG